MTERNADPVANLIAALDVRRNAVLGFGFGVAFTAVLYAVFVVGPGTRHSPLLYLALAVVLALSLGAFVTTMLTALSAWRLARDVE